MNDTPRRNSHRPILTGVLAVAILMMLTLGRMRREAGRPDTHAHQDADADLHPRPRPPRRRPQSRRPRHIPRNRRPPRRRRSAPTETPEPPTPEPTAAPPTATQRPAATKPAPPPAQPTAPPPAAADPCAGIGGDGCKWRVTGGPSFGDTGGQELKLQFIFLHSGVEGGQPQGSYFVVLEKDGQKLPISDGVRSISGSASQGTLGKYNYEYSLGVDKLPGNTVAGNYTLWVLGRQRRARPAGTSRSACRATAD